MQHVSHSALPTRRTSASLRARPLPRHRAETRRDGVAVRRLAAGAVTGVALGAVLGVGPAAPAQADEIVGIHHKVEEPPGSRVVDIAAAQAGTPYAYGANGPGAFDCSGFTQWVYARTGRNLPRTSAAQAGAVRRIAAADARPGDLVFFTGAGGVYHVGIYAGRGAVWHAPRPGEGVQRSGIWTDDVFFGRP